MIPDPPNKPGKPTTSRTLDAVVLIVMIVCVSILAFAGKIPPTLLALVYGGSLGWVGAKVTSG